MSAPTTNRVPVAAGARRHAARDTRRRGVVALIVTVALVTLLGVAALTVDVGMMYQARNDAQISADAAAMAAAWQLLDEDRLLGSPDPSQELAAARERAAEIAARNPILRQPPGLNLGTDVQIGYYTEGPEGDGRDGRI